MVAICKISDRWQRKVGTFDGEVKKPEESDPKFGKWRSRNSLVATWLLNSMEPAIAKPHMFMTTTKNGIRYVNSTPIWRIPPKYLN